MNVGNEKRKVRVVKATKYVPKKCDSASITHAKVAKNEAKLKPQFPKEYAVHYYYDCLKQLTATTTTTAKGD